MNRTRTIATTLAAGLIAAGATAALSSLPSNAVQLPSRVTSTCGTCVAPITSLQEDSLVFDYVGKTACGCANGYWRARQANGSVWVRLTLVGGN
jgi:pyrroline-5-carboxylate reductase